VQSGVWRIEHREPTCRHKAAFVTESNPFECEYELLSGRLPDALLEPASEKGNDKMNSKQVPDTKMHVSIAAVQKYAAIYARILVGYSAWLES
jgi:hypothetical protein